jgi:murein DD-endopeptidase MepM/ murein hydrolase activator NlpD
MTKDSILKNFVLAPSLLLALSATVACSSIHLPGYKSNSDSSFQFNPMPLTLSSDQVSEGPLGFISPLELKFEFDWPVDRARLTRGFMPNARPRPHLGLDLAGPKGTPIFAALDGHVIYAGTGFRGYGRFVIIEHGNDWATFYSHLDKILIKQGQTIKQGELIGKMGRTGRATGTHLHFELRRDRKAIDPIAFLPMASDWVSKKN